MASRFLSKLALGASFAAASAYATEKPYEQYISIASLEPDDEHFKIETYTTGALAFPVKDSKTCKQEIHKVPAKADFDNLFLRSNPDDIGEKLDNRFLYLNIFRKYLNDCKTPEACKQAFDLKVTFFEEGCEDKKLADLYKAFMIRGFELLRSWDRHTMMGSLTSDEEAKIDAILAAAQPDTTCRDCCCAWSLLCGAATAVAGISMGTYYLMFGCEDEAAAAVKEDQEEMKKLDKVLHTVGLHHDPEHPDAEGKGWSPLYVYFLIAACCFTLAFVAFKIYERKRYNGTRLNNGVRNVRAGEFDSDTDDDFEDETYYGEGSICEEGPAV